MKLFLNFLLLIFLISCTPDDLNSQVPEPIDYQNSPYVNMGVAFESNDKNQPLYGTHSSWTHANVAYDKSLDKAVVFYNIKNGHMLTHNRVAMRFKDIEGGFSDLLVVADREAEGVSCKTQASGIAANGDYISLVALFNNSNGSIIGSDIYRSSDKGKSWSRTDMLVGNERVKAFNGDVTGFLLLKSGRILTLACHPETRRTRILYSDDNAVTWHFASVSECFKHTEPAWCELSDGTIICYLRSTVGDAGYSTKIPAYFTRSFDGGLTWELPVPSKSILNMNEANGQLIFYEKSKKIEFLHHSRYPEEDGYSSILLSVASEKDAKNDNMGEELRIVKLPRQNGSYNGDSGYIGGCKSKSGIVIAFYYSGSMTDANIYYLVKKPKS
ncbi:exo-alpha-sialidase [Dysgonomonas sp. GY617]|nr:exo-alpha-sialidase [Dysgonomonas sp. GY617]